MFYKNKRVQTVVLIVLILVYIFKYVVLYANIPTGSMKPLFNPGDKVIANIFPYNFLGDPERFDVVIFKTREYGNSYVTKRVIGLPGDTVEIKSGQLYINGEEVYEPYLYEPYEGDYGPYNVPEKSYFLLGDNRNGSDDARFWKDPYIKRKDIIGVILYKVKPEIVKINP